MEARLLAHDVALIKQACQTLSQRVLDVADEDQLRYYAIAGDLWQKLVNHSQAVATLLTNGPFESAVVVNRAVYETTINLVYLISVGDKLRNARLFELRMILEVPDVLPDQSETSNKFLARAPEEMVSFARKAKKSRTGWSGKTLDEMATAVKLGGHKAAYAVQSWASHARMAGYSIEETRHGVGGMSWVFTSSDARPAEMFAIANHTRRMLHRVYALVTRDFFGEVLPLATTSPFQTIVEHRRREGCGGKGGGL